MKSSDIYYIDNNDKNMLSIRVYFPNMKTASLFVAEADENLVFRCKQVEIVNTVITVLKSVYTQISSANLNILNFRTTDYIKIVRVCGGW